MLETICSIIPIYGDIKIHRLFKKDRERARQKIQNIKEESNELDEREEQFKQELSDLVKKHNIKEEMGSLISYPSQYVHKERSNLGDIMIRSTIIPEIIMYAAKYGIIMALYYQFS